MFWILLVVGALMTLVAYEVGWRSPLGKLIWIMAVLVDVAFAFVILAPLYGTH